MIPKKAAMASVLLVALPAAAVAQDTGAEAASGWFTSLTGFLGTGVVGAVLGFFGKWVFDEISATRKVRREFAAKVTDQIDKLAQEHYWRLANRSGVYSGLLDNYLSIIDFHLILNYQNKQEMDVRLEQIADTYADRSFHALCRLLWLFDRFQFRGSNTYLLTSDAAGRVCRRLYNSFMARLPLGEEDPTLHLDTLAILAEMERRAPDKDGMLVADLPEAEFMAKARREGSRLNPPYRAYREWMRARWPDVAAAAGAMRAYNEVLSHELALLYRDWYDRRRVDVRPYAEAVAYGAWPQVLSAEAVHAISSASFQGELLYPLGLHRPAEFGRPRPQREPSSEQAPEEKLERQSPPSASGRALGSS